MEMSYSTLKCKEVINVNDGHRLGKTKDLVFQVSDGKILGIVVPGSCGFHLFGGNDLYIDLRNIVKIGDDVVLADVRGRPPEKRTTPFPPFQNEKGRDRRNYEEYE